MSTRIIVGDALERLRELPDESVHCVVTSPPYWGLRAYGGDAGMIGLEPTFDDHLANLVAVFREVRRVLRSDGTLWLNYGDSYAASGSGGGAWHGGKQGSNNGTVHRNGKTPGEYKPKDLMMMPARVAMALQTDGWWLRSEIVWQKLNPMPESVTDRPTSAHEKVFLLTKAPRYFFDNEAVREGAVRDRMKHDENVHRMQSGIGSRELSDKAGWPPSWSAVPFLRGEADAGMAGGESGTQSRERPAIQGKPEWEGEAGRISEVGSEQGNSEALQADPVRESSNEALSVERSAAGGSEAACTDGNMQSQSEEIPRDGKRPSVFGTGSSQTAHGIEGGIHPDSRGVGEDSRGEQISLLLLQGEGEVDNGSCHSIKQGRGACGDERSASMPELQHQKGKQNLSPSVDKQRGHARPHDGFNGKWDAMPKDEQQAGGANLRNVWAIDEDEFQQFLQWKAERAGEQMNVLSLATHAFPGAHFATFPPALVEPCIKAGTSAKGVCGKCGAPWVREVERGEVAKAYPERLHEDGLGYGRKNRAGDTGVSLTTGWRPTCEHAAAVIPATVLDPFAGSGTVGLVADRLCRDAILIELNPEYAAMAEQRIVGENPLFCKVEVDHLGP